MFPFTEFIQHEPSTGSDTPPVRLPFVTSVDRFPWRSFNLVRHPTRHVLPRLVQLTIHSSPLRLLLRHQPPEIPGVVHGPCMAELVDSVSSHIFSRELSSLTDRIRGRLPRMKFLTLSVSMHKAHAASFPALIGRQGILLTLEPPPVSASLDFGSRDHSATRFSPGEPTCTFASCASV